ncbi:MAG: response regulator transcription factor [Ilumatobacteraceae bacterium]
MRVVIADDSALWREGLARLLEEAGVEVVALVGDAAALEEAVERLRPDVAVVDVRMPPTWTREGAQAAGRLRENWPDMGLLLLSQSIEGRSAATVARATLAGSATCSRTASSTYPLSWRRWRPSVAAARS